MRSNEMVKRFFVLMFVMFCAIYRDEDPKLLQPPKKGPRILLGLASILRALTVVLFLGPVLYYSDRFLLRHWRRTADALSIFTFWVTVAVPIAVAVIFIHLIVRIGRGDDHKLRGSDPNKRHPDLISADLQ